MNQKKTPVSRGPYGAALRVVETAGVRGNSPCLRQGGGGTQTVVASYSPADGMLGAGQREI